jgi:hypothetical protein
MSFVSVPFLSVPALKSSESTIFIQARSTSKSLVAFPDENTVIKGVYPNQGTHSVKFATWSYSNTFVKSSVLGSVGQQSDVLFSFDVIGCGAVDPVNATAYDMSWMTRCLSDLSKSKNPSTCLSRHLTSLCVVVSLAKKYTSQTKGLLPSTILRHLKSEAQWKNPPV